NATNTAGNWTPEAIIVGKNEAFEVAGAEAWPDSARFEDTLGGQAMPRRVKPGHRLAAESIVNVTAVAAKLCPSHRDLCLRPPREVNA
ncbi:MAG TPA: hypothetical protein PK867_29910, partial [Pirellulales bacterium]|nr:hypothetical protein [Pirellulales bacterium]